MENNTHRDLSQKEEDESQSSAKKSSKVVLVWLIVLGVLGVLAWTFVRPPKAREGEILADNGVHWHIELSIFIDGAQVEVPANIGLKTPGIHPGQMHTHEPDNLIHAEKPGVVTSDDMRLKEFFRIWNRDFSSDTILGNKVNEEKSITFLVDGEESQDFEEYVLQDGARVEIRFE